MFMSLAIKDEMDMDEVLDWARTTMLSTEITSQLITSKDDIDLEVMVNTALVCYMQANNAYSDYYLIIKAIEWLNDSDIPVFSQKFLLKMGSEVVKWYETLLNFIKSGLKERS